MAHGSIILLIEDHMGRWQRDAVIILKVRTSGLQDTSEPVPLSYQYMGSANNLQYYCSNSCILIPHRPCAFVLGQAGIETLGRSTR